MKLAVYQLVPAELGKPPRMLVLVTDEQGRAWRATVDAGEIVDEREMLGPAVPTYNAMPSKRGLDGSPLFGNLS